MSKQNTSGINEEEFLRFKEKDISSAVCRPEHPFYILNSYEFCSESEQIGFVFNFRRLSEANAAKSLPKIGKSNRSFRYVYF